MSVLIKGMEMPKSCSDCPLEDPYDGYNCRITGRGYNWGLIERPSDCPIIWVPPHGRLIDADALIDIKDFIYKSMLFGGEIIFSKSAIDNAPTIIEGEGDE